MKKSAFSDFSEGAMEQAYEAWEFKTCQRSDGSYYGTAGNCSQRGSKEVKGSKADNVLGQMTLDVSSGAGKTASNPVSNVEKVMKGGWDPQTAKMMVESHKGIRKSSAYTQALSDNNKNGGDPKNTLILADAAEKQYTKNLAYSEKMIEQLRSSGGRGLNALIKRHNGMVDYYDNHISKNLDYAKDVVKGLEKAGQTASPAKSKSKPSGGGGKPATAQDLQNAMAGLMNSPAMQLLAESNRITKPVKYRPGYTGQPFGKAPNGSDAFAYDGGGGQVDIRDIRGNYVRSMSMQQYMQQKNANISQGQAYFR